MAQSIKKNYIYNLISTISTLVFQLVSFPYVSRVLLPDGVGHIDFYHSVIQYITLLSCLGIPMYAIREIARVRNDSSQRNNTALEILTLHFILTIIGYVIVFVLSQTVTEIMQDLPLFFILSLSIFFTTIGCEWFYKGLEDFKYITIRGVIVRVLSLILLFVFVREKDDLYVYASLLILGTVGNNLLNFLRLRKFLSLKEIELNDFRPIRHLRPVLRIFMLNLITSIYVQLNTVMLGFMSSDTSVGLFSSASKLSHFLLTFGAALGTAMLPRMSNLISEGKTSEFRLLSNKSMSYMVGISLPITLGLIVVAPMLMTVFCGKSFEPAVLTLQILSPIIIMISMSNVLGIQILYPLGKENLVIVTTGIGALVNLLLNFLLIPLYAHNGAAISTAMAEIAVTLSMLIVGKKYFSFDFLTKSYLCYLVGTVVMTICIYYLRGFLNSNIFGLLLLCSIGVLTYGLCLIAMKESLAMQILSTLKNKINHK